MKVTNLQLHWGPAIHTTDTEVDSLIPALKVWLSESRMGGPGNDTSTDTGTPVYKNIIATLSCFHFGTLAK